MLVLVLVLVLVVVVVVVLVLVLVLDWCQCAYSTHHTNKKPALQHFF